MRFEQAGLEVCRARHSASPSHSLSYFIITSAGKVSEHGHLLEEVRRPRLNNWCCRAMAPVQAISWVYSSQHNIQAEGSREHSGRETNRIARGVLSLLMDQKFCVSTQSMASDTFLHNSTYSKDITISIPGTVGIVQLNSDSVL